MAKIVALCGLAGRAVAGVGKSEVASYLEREWGFERVRFADPLKNMLRSLYRDAGLDDETIERKLEGDLKEQPCEVLRGKTPRQAMRWLGTEWGRDLIAPDFWTELWARRAFPHRNVVVEDCRFDNEAEAVRRAGGLVVAVLRPSLDAAADGCHVSEAGIADPDGFIMNDGDLRKLAYETDAIAQAVIGGF